MCGYQDVGVAMYKRFAFYRYLHNHTPRPHILKTCLISDGEPMTEMDLAVIAPITRHQPIRVIGKSDVF